MFPSKSLVFNLDLKRSVGYSLSAMQNYKELTDNVSHATLIRNILQPEILTLILHLILLTPL